MNTKMEQKQKDKIWLDNFVKDCNDDVFQMHEIMTIQLDTNVFEQRLTLKDLSEQYPEEEKMIENLKKNYKRVHDLETDPKDEYMFNVTDLATVIGDTTRAIEMFDQLEQFRAHKEFL